MTFSRSQTQKRKMEHRQLGKFTRLIKNDEQCLKQGTCSRENEKLVVNLSSRPITPTTQAALAKGLNFAPTPRKIPVEAIITGIEETIAHNKIPDQDAECLRQDVSSVMRKSKLPKPNMSKREFTALKDLRNDSSLLVLPADKGNATVIVDTAAYEKKLTELVRDECIYKKVNYNPTARVTSGLDSLLRSSPDDSLRRHLRPQNPTAPKIYGLPKIHKPNWPLRPIVSQIDSPTYKTSRYMSDILQPLTGKTASYIKDSTHFIQQLANVRLADEELMVSFDVTSLFTNVPVEDTLHRIDDLIKNAGLPTVYMSIIEYCLKSGFFVWRGEYYLQMDGVAMGSPIAPVVANIFMEWFEERALSTTEDKPRFWWRYVDDVLPSCTRIV
ncbi:uncharacterized protein LOC119190756 [Manduca sexta]|uniref:uncharacterized protein LOC119190756 n=1 Tax=Manduca sexta TaxID=7130 RepID=UPI00188F90EA|nr:uncharacterized protein LOC119190756 [Manduca sexta]